MSTPSPVLVAIILAVVCAAALHADTGSPDADCPAALEIRRYDLDLAINPVEDPYSMLYGGDINVTCGTSVRNSGTQPCAEIPLILYRLLEVRAVRDEAGAGVPFNQEVKLHPDPNFGERHHINRVTLRPTRPLEPGEERIFTIEYEGAVCGRPESLPYVWDHVSWDYTLLHFEVIWFPTLAYPELRFPPFTYRANISIPTRLVAVAEGKLLGVREADGRTVYSYESDYPHNALFSIAAAPFETSQVAEGIDFYFLPGHAERAQVAARALERTEELCADWFGIAPPGRLRLVEVPEGYGSQSAPGLILQTSDTFAAEDGDDSAAYRRALPGLGHEAIHRWHPLPYVSDQTRWLDEGIAHYFEALLVREEFGDQPYRNHLDGYRRRFLRGGEEALRTPIAKAGESAVTEPVSRGKGPWALYTLHHWLGEEAFLGIMRAYFRTYRGQHVTLQDFVAVAKQESPQDLTRFFDEWFYGTESSAYLKDGLSVEEIVARYR